MPHLCDGDGGDGDGDDDDTGDDNRINRKGDVHGDDNYNYNDIVGEALHGLRAAPV
jgi:hypothetical protein